MPHAAILESRRWMLARMAAALGVCALPAAVRAFEEAAQPLNADALDRLRDLREGTLRRLIVHGEGMALPDLPIHDEFGGETSLAAWRGRVLLVNFWATWCPPCRKEMPSLDRLEGALGGGDFSVLAVSQDRNGAAKARSFYDSTGIAHLGVYVDPGGNLARAVGVLGLPATILVDRAGAEVARLTGEAKWDAKEVVRLLRRMIEFG